MRPMIARKPARRRACGSLPLCAVTWVLALAGAVPGNAQAQVVIGQGGGHGGVAVANDPGGGVVVNSSVLDSLGAGPGADMLPYGAPSPYEPGADMLPYGAPSPYPPATGGGGLTPYPSPGDGPLVISRPGTLLFPPQQPPRSRLTVPPPSGQRADAPAPRRPSGELPSRLLVERPRHQGTIATRAPGPAPVARPKPPTVARPEPVETVAPAQPATDTPEVPVAAVTAPAPSVSGDQPAPPDPPPAKPQAAAPAEAVAAPSLPPAPSAQAEASEAEPSPPPPAAAETPPAADTATIAAAPAVPAPAPPQTAARPRGDGIAERRILFDETSADLSEAAKAELAALADALKEDPAARIQLLAYAKDRGAGSSRARRVSLSRALSVRAFLIDQGIRSTRMDVRALGDKAQDGPSERVDILPQETRQ